MITPVSNADLKKLKCVLVNSSIAKTIPPSGVLKAAASPAAAPVTIIFRLDIFGYQSGNRSFIFLNIDADICIVGPSLPMTPPPNTITKLERIFIKMTLKLSSELTLLLCFGIVNSIAAVT